MLLTISGILVGLICGIIFPFHIPARYTQYVAVGILAALDSVFGGVNARLSGRFNEKIFLSGFIGNAALAVILSVIGKRLDLDIYLAAVVVFGTRLFQNFAEIRRYLLNSRSKNGKIK